MVIRRAEIPSPWRLAAKSSAGSKLVEVGQRLAHAHHHDMAEAVVGGQQLGKLQHLLEDLAGGQIADHAAKSAGAEHAPHGASPPAC